MGAIARVNVESKPEEKQGATKNLDSEDGEEREIKDFITLSLVTQTQGLKRFTALCPDINKRTQWTLQQFG